MEKKYSDKKMLLSCLPDRAARLCLEVESFIKEQGLKTAGKEFILAYSGGADSKALFFILLVLQPRLGFTLSLAHLDHSFRPTSAAELVQAEQLAQDYGITAKTRRVDVARMASARGLGAEEAGREARLEFLRELRADTPAESWIVQGHQLNDLAEDCLMRLIRGAGWPALAGMRAVDPQQGILRPILLIQRARLEDFLSDLGQSWLKDPMNEDQNYLRNRVRRTLLPAFIKENPSFLDSVEERWRMACQDKDYFDISLSPVLKEVIEKEGELLMPRSVLKSCPAALRLRLYAILLARLGSGQALSRSLRKLDEAVTAGKSGPVFQFPGKKEVRLERHSLYFMRKK